MTYSPGIGKTPNDWREEEARRRESRERVHNPYGREPARATRAAIGWGAALVVAAVVALTLLGLLGIVPIFRGPA